MTTNTSNKIGECPREKTSTISYLVVSCMLVYIKPPTPPPPPSPPSTKSAKPPRPCLPPNPHQLRNPAKGGVNEEEEGKELQKHLSAVPSTSQGQSPWTTFHYVATHRNPTADQPAIIRHYR